ncbi:23S rRNA (guanosine(2251)-2'-O)-methyltransferase RlmB [Rufibacter glacialis]|uniref:23S rRNA (Guanosine(2251)-2'-O)-methyltransferase RlmB n=1 Tax=Rufibacter glacialis TaxID=1259555 RepID=A0A5M8QNA8_9BACT|nr:23S rRNA (guanosine(2251)-2'-O)-methyltransferase RlmB [Rufibacter glacialis]KAA6437569.1 23S rRNA (guanosine(2251)-2'-O)-methyltransferase RlmB [Rufibacter glacialis]GGK58245.1 23S rRNA (guanosine(2251)-2'-O)-methyltransferase RlmB [Rufibacter glacialis]
MENRNNRDRDGGGKPRHYTQPKVDKMEMVFGLRPILEALHAGKTMEKIYLLKGTKHSISQEITELAKEAQIPISLVPVEKLDQLTRKNHQGAVGYLSAISYSPLDEIVASIFEKGKDPLLLVLDRITDVRNFGAIARNAECMGVDAIVIPSRGAAQINADALKTSAGALSLIPVCRETNLKDTLQFLRQSGIRVVACTEKAEDNLTDTAVDLTGPVAVLMGSEEDGISPEYLKRADVRVKIPMVGQVQSLNVSVASGIILYEALRQRQAQ